MIWKFINSGENTGKFNMDFDIELAQNCKDGEAYFRIYRWKPYCISLGANQKYEDINLEKLQNDGFEIVKRPTGGRAILHSEEITYSVVIPVNAGFSSTEIYKMISLALVKGLKNYDPRLNEVELESNQPDFAMLLKDPKGVACFASTAKSEVKYKGKKLIGSAQRKMNKVILQHGSIMCGDFHLNLVDYMNIEKSEVPKLKDEIFNSTIDVSSILKDKVDYDKVIENLVNGFEEQWKIKFQKEEVEL